MPVRKNDILIELGDTGLKRQTGWIFEEFLPELRAERGIKIYKEMGNNDPIISGMLYAIKMLIRGVHWRVDAVSDDKKDQEAAEFLESCMHDMEETWDNLMDEILSMLDYGWAWHEKVYKRRLGDNRDKTKDSKFNDGRIGWRKLPIRSQDTWNEWKFNEVGDVTAMVQQSPVTFELLTIPTEKSLHFRTTSHKNNPEGRSILRGAYTPYYFKKHIQRIEGIGIERDLAGLPYFKVPARLLSPDASDTDKLLLDNFKKIVKNVRRDEQEGLVLPLEYNEAGKELFDFGLISTGSRRMFNTNEVINRYNRDILISTLTDFLMLGHEKVGSFALSSSKTDIFALSIAAILDNIEEVFNNDAIPDLFALNQFSLSELPKLRHGDIETADLNELGEFIAKVSGAGMELFPDDDLENHFRQQAGWPEKKVEEIVPDTKPGEPGEPIVPAAPETPAVDQALNGAQIASMVEVVTAVASGQIPRTSGVQIIASGFNMSTADADKLISEAGKGFKPTPKEPTI